MDKGSIVLDGPASQVLPKILGQDPAQKTPPHDAPTGGQGEL
jgi:hypothetical protein